ncbi:MAG: HigA family addiction module antitoxin [Thermoanaerobaculia bacterium]
MSRNEYHPSEVLPPGATLAETLAAIGMTQAELARRANRPIKTINEIVQGKAEITADTAIQLERVLSVPASFWQNLERNYRESLARARDRRDLERHVDRLREIPVSAMEKLGWIPRGRGEVEKLSNVLAFFGVASVEALEQRADARFRASRAFQANRIAVGAWLRRGHLEAQKIDCAQWNAAFFEKILDQARKLAAAMPEDFASRLTQLCARAGVAVVYVPELPGTRLWGATRWVSDKPIIQLSLRYRREDHFWFTFFHEAAHVLKHGKRELFIETDGDAGDEKESEANRFAADFLALASQLREHFGSGFVSAESVRRFAARAGVSPGIVVGRLQYEGLLPRTHLNGLVRRLTWPSSPASSR